MTRADVPRGAASHDRGDRTPAPVSPTHAPHVGAGAHATREAGDIEPAQHGATCAHPGRPVAEVLAAIGTHFSALAGAFQELAGSAAITLDDPRDLSPGVRVETTTEKATAQRRFLTVADVAALLAVDAKTVRRWRDEGRTPPAVSVGGVVRWRPEVVEEWLAGLEAGR